MPYLSRLTTSEETIVSRALHDLETHNRVVRHDARLVYFYNRRGALSNQEKRVFMTLFMRSTPDEVAGLYEGNALPNGVWNVLLSDQMATEVFNIHTVQEGVLSGQRIVKRKIDGRFKAFGFITCNSKIRFWRPYREHENEAHFQLAEALFAHLRSYDGSVHWHSYSFAARCRRCNVQISRDSYNDPTRATSGFCFSCATTHSPAQLYGRMGEEARRDVYRSMMEVNAPPPNATSVTIVEPPSAPRRNLLMSENDPTIVR